MTKRRSIKLKMTEFDEAFSEDMADGTAVSNQFFNPFYEKFRFWYMFGIKVNVTCIICPQK